MTISIPQLGERKLVKGDRGDVFGNLTITKNIDLEKNPGKIRLSERLYKVFDDTDDGDFLTPLDAIQTDADDTDRWWVVAGDQYAGTGLLFKTAGTDPLAAYTQDALANSPTDATGDMAVFGSVGGEDRLVVARNGNLAQLVSTAGGTWTSNWWTGTLSGPSLDTSIVPIRAFRNLLIVASDNEIHTLDDSLVLTQERIVLPAYLKIIWLRDDGNRIFIGTKHLRGGEALVFPWDVFSETYDEPLSVFSSIALAGINKNGVMHVLNDRGQLLGFNGNALEEVARLPITETGLQWKNQTAPTVQPVYSNGMDIIDDEIHVLLDGTIGGTGGDVYERMPSGIWVQNEHGFRQKYSVGEYDGTTNDSWGACAIRQAGMLKRVSKEKGAFLAGARVYTDGAATTIRKALFASKTSSTTDQRGYFVTAEMRGEDLMAFYQRLHVFLARKLENSTDLVVVKYRTTKKRVFEEDNFANQLFTGTWDSVSSATLTINDADGANITAGDEVEIVRGNGEGALAHISSITNTSANNYTIVLDESVPNAANSGTFSFRVQNWKKLGTISDQNIEKKIFTIAKRAKWMQLKVELRGTDTSPEIDHLLQEFSKSRR